MRLVKAVWRMLPVLGLGLSLAYGGVPVSWERILQAEEERNGTAPFLMQAVKSPDAKLRARAALAYGRIQQPASVEPLLGLLRDRDAGVREAVAFGLGQLGWSEDFTEGRDQDILTKLTPLLKDPHSGVRAAAAEAIGKIGREKVPLLLAAVLKDQSPAVRAAAALAFQRSRQILKLRESEGKAMEVSDAQLQPLLALATDPDVGVRRAVGVYFSRFQDVRGQDVLLRLSRDKDAEVRAFALGGLGKIADSKNAAVLRAQALDPETSVRIAAALALKTSKAYGLLPVEWEQDPSFHLRALAASLATDELHLRKLIKDTSATVRGEALKSLARLKKNSVAVELASAQTDPSWVVRAAAVEAGSDVEAERETRLKTALKDAAPQVRAAALEALGTNGELDSGWAYEALKEALTSPELAIRGAAASALEKRHEKTVAELAWKTYQDSFDEKWVEVREGLIELIGKSPGETTPAELRQGLADPALSVARKARKALASRGVSTPPLTQPAVVSSSPYRGLRFTRNPHVLLETSRGRIEIECFAADAPVHVANFVGVVKAGGYDGLLWHRVVPNFVIQGGDPDGTGWGSGGYSLRAEISRQRFERGTVGMPRSQGFDTGGVQLFITHVAAPHLDGQYTVFGRVVQGLEVVNRIEAGDKILHAHLVK